MTAIAIKHFDALDYVEQSRALGVDERVAKYQARQMEQVIEIESNAAKADVENRALATKQDIKELELSTKKDMQALEALIYKSKAEVIIWVAGLLLASGLIQHFLK